MQQRLQGSKLSRLPTKLANVEEDILNRVPTLYRITVSVTHTWFGWTADKQVRWISHVIAAAPFGMGNLMIHVSGSM